MASYNNDDDANDDANDDDADDDDHHDTDAILLAQRAFQIGSKCSLIIQEVFFYFFTFSHIWMKMHIFALIFNNQSFAHLEFIKSYISISYFFERIFDFPKFLFKKTKYLRQQIIFASEMIFAHKC